jgi:uncharacterized protein (DUF2225 family)
MRIVQFICMVCRTPLGRIDADTIRMPYTTDQFLPLRDGARQPFLNIIPDFKDWWCPQCHRKPMLPDKVWTEQGWIEAKPVDPIEELIDEMVPDEPEIPVEGPVVIASESRKIHQCPHCQKTFKNAFGLNGHIRFKHKDITNG